MCDRVGRGGDYNERIDRLRNRNVLDGGIDIGLMLFARRKHTGDHFFTGERCEGKGTNKFLRRARHHHLHANSTILQQANDFRGFVSRDAAGHTQSDFHNCLIADF